MTATASAPVIGRDLYPLPATPASTSPELATLVERYDASWRDGTRDTEVGRAFPKIASEIDRFACVSAADVATKLAHGLHYMHPDETADGRLAIDTRDFAINEGGSILISCMNEMHALAGAGDSADQRAAFDAAYRRFAELKAIEDVLPTGTNEQEEAFDEAVNRTGIAFEALAVINVSDPARVGLKFSAFRALHNMPMCTFDRGLAERLYSDVERALGVKAISDGLLQAAWDAALAKYETAWAKWDDLVGDYTNEETEAVCDVASPARDALINAPAPSLAALVKKIEIARVDQRHPLEEDWDAVLADVRRFAAMEG